MIYQLLTAYFEYDAMTLSRDCTARLYERVQAGRDFRSKEDQRLHIEIDRIDAEWFGDSGLPKPDITVVQGLLALNSKALEILKPFLSDEAEVFPFTVEGQHWHLVNLLPPQDSALAEISDEQTLISSCFDSTITATLSFKKDANLPELFCIKAANGRFFCSDAVKLAIESAGLKGLVITENLIVHDYSLIGAA